MSSTTPNVSKRHISSNDAQPQKTSLMQYIGFFAIGYILASSLFIVIQTQIMMNAQVVTVLSILLGAYIAVYKFVKHQQRMLTNSESNRLTIYSVGTVWLLTIIYFLCLWLLLFDSISREVLIDMAIEQPLPLLGATVTMIILTLVSARIGILVFNRLLTPK